jgi:hypothetical protein
MVQNAGFPLWKLLAYVCQIAMYKEFSLFNVDFKRQNWPSARCTLAANAIDRELNINSGTFGLG